MRFVSNKATRWRHFGTIRCVIGTFIEQEHTFTQNSNHQFFSTINQLKFLFNNHHPSFPFFFPQTNQPKITSNEQNNKNRPCRDATRDTIYPRLEKDFDQLIEAVLVKRTCKYMLADGGTAAKAVNGRQCGQLVTTGTEFLTRSMAFATPKNWTHSDVLAKAMLTVHNGHQLPSFQEYVDQFHTCAQTTLPTISVARLKVFFGLAFTFGACILMGMIIDPQKPVNGGNEPDVSVISSSSGDERDNEDGDGDEDDVEMLSEEEDVEEGRGGVGGDQRGGHGNGADGDDDGDGVEGKVVNGTQKDMDEEDGNVLEQDSMKTTFRDESSSSSTTKPK